MHRGQSFLRELRLLLLTSCVLVLAACGGGGGTDTAPDMTAVPAAPTGLTGTPGNAQVALTWTATTGAASYHVKRATGSGGPYTQVAAPTSPSFTDTGLTNGTAYFYVVSAVNSAGEGANSAEVSETPTAPAAQAPSAPTGVTAAAGNAQIVLSWSASTGATSYHVKRANTNGGPYTQVAAPTSATYTDTGLANGTAYYYVVSAVNSAGESANSTQANATPAATQASNVTITATPSSTKTISKYIYGANIPAVTGITVPTASLTIDRLGGNRWTGYNWQTNYSNAGSDFNYQSDQYLSSSTTPLAAITGPFATDRGNGIAGLMTVPLLGYVAADANGAVSLTNPIQTSRFKSVVFAKGSAFTTTPSNSNASVYVDEMVWATNQFYSGMNVFTTNAALPIFIELDNEPDLWFHTHQEMETSTEIGYNAFFSKSTAAATAIKAQFPQATLYGPAISGFAQFYYWDSSYPTPTPNGNNWLIDGYIGAVKSAETSAGHSLVDVISLHWYSQIDDPVSGTQISGDSAASLTDAQMQLIVQSPRSLWDSTFVESSYITRAVAINAIRLIPRLQDKLAAAGVTKGLSFTEYFNGGNNNIAGLIAQADNLGIFGQYGLHSAYIWPVNDAPYPMGAFAAFRNFDGAGANFGDTSVTTSSSNTANVVAYVSTDSSRAGRVVMVVINRSNASQTATITGQPLSGTAHLYHITATTAATQGTNIKPVSAGTQAASGSSLTVTTPAYSVTTIDIF